MGSGRISDFESYESYLFDNAWILKPYSLI